MESIFNYIDGAKESQVYIKVKRKAEEISVSQ
jgi:hypothetical protein